MRIEYEGLSLSFEPVTSIAAGLPRRLITTLHPTSDDARVEVEFRRNGGGAQRVRGQAVEPGESFVVMLPPFEAGDRVTVTLTGWVGHHRVPALGDEAAAQFELEVEGLVAADEGLRAVSEP